MFKYKINEEIELKILEVRHANEVYSLTDENRSSLREWLPWLDITKNSKDTENFIKIELERFSKTGGFSAGIWFKGNLTGVISLMDMNMSNKSASIGYWLGSKFTGNGIMTKSCRQLTNYAFNELELHRVEIRCAENNLKSRAIPERLNFQKEGVIRESEYLYDHYVSHVIYGMLAKEWNENL